MVSRMEFVKCLYLIIPRTSVASSTFKEKRVMNACERGIKQQKLVIGQRTQHIQCSSIACISLVGGRSLAAC